jgi:hypothetical protein
MVVREVGVDRRRINEWGAWTIEEFRRLWEMGILLYSSSYLLFSRTWHLTRKSVGYHALYEVM